MKLQNWAWLFAAILLMHGILGFVPGVTSDGYLFGVFEVDPMQNVIHLISGIAAAIAAGASLAASRTYFRVFGIIYALLAIIGFIQGDTIVGLTDVNTADHILHLVIAATALWLGYHSKDAPSVMV